MSYDPVEQAVEQFKAQVFANAPAAALEKFNQVKASNAMRKQPNGLKAQVAQRKQQRGAEASIDASEDVRFEFPAGRNSKELRDCLEDVSDEMRRLVESAEDNGGEFTAHEQARFDALEDHAQDVRARLDKRSKMEQAKATVAATGDLPPAFNPFQRQPDEGNSMSAIASTKREPKYQHVVRLKAFKDPKEALASGLWLRALHAKIQGGQDSQAEERYRQLLNVKAQQTIGTPADGGYTVPSPLSDAVWNVRELSGLCRRVARTYATSANTLDIPKKLTTFTVEYPAEATTITESKESWGQINGVCVKRACYAKVSQELVDDAIISYLDNVAQEMGSDLAVNEDREFIAGDGSAASGGVDGIVPLLGAAGLVTGAADWASMTLDEVMATLALLPGKYLPNASIVCSHQFYSAVLLRLAAEAGSNSFADMSAGDRQPGEVVRKSFLGYDVWLTPQMATATAATTTSMLFGDFAASSALIDRIGVRIATSNDVHFQEDCVAVRATVRYDIKNHHVSDGSDVRAVVGLATA